ncbi:MAG: TRAP transporter substrate-binding protein DctP [Leucobacter sp.]|nr:TRAP transporter substrate-binding protein DctP [Leucobacter sp.]
MSKSIRLKPVLALAAVGVLALTACSSGSSDGGSASGEESVTINSVTMVQPNVPTAPLVEWFYSQLEERSDGRITVDRTEPESICKAPEIAECVRDGRADLGVSISDYSASLFPSMSVAGIPFMADNPQALMSALYEVNTNNNSAVAQWESLGIEYIAAWSPGTTIIGTNSQVTDIKGLNGLQIRAIGSALPQALDMVGASVVSMPAAETYENIERGVADAVSWSMDGPVDYKLMEQLSDWVDPGVGAYTTFTMWMNKDFYDSLPEDLRAIVDEVRDELNAGVGMEQFSTVTDSQCDVMLDFPNIKSLTAWDESATDEWKNLVQDDLIAAYIAQAEADGLADAQGYFDDYVAALNAAASDSTDILDPVAACVERFAAR